MQSTNINWLVRDQQIDLSKEGLIMGILNVTPDSFSDGGNINTINNAVELAQQMQKDGADIIDVGGESTRPNATSVSADEEIARTIPVIKAIREKSSILISIDTSKAVVAEAAILAGADIVNDVTGLTGDPNMISVCNKHDVAIVIMHMQGNPRTMQQKPQYNNVTQEVLSYFKERLETMQFQGIKKERICLDPGIGFGKTVEHNLELMRNIATFSIEGRPCLIGVSRKSILGKLLDKPNPKDRDWGTVAATAYTRKKGAMIHRVHNVKKNSHSLRMIEAILNH